MVLPHSGLLKMTDTISSPTDQWEEWTKRLWLLLARVEEIQSKVQPRLIRGNTVRDADRVTKAGQKSLKFLAQNSQYLKKDLKSGFIRIATDYYRPMQLIETKSKKSYDTPENRFLRWVLMRIREKLHILKFSLFQKEGVEDLQSLKSFLRMEREVGRLLEADCMLDRGEMHLVSGNEVLQMSISYRDVYRSYLLLMKGIQQALNL